MWRLRACAGKRLARPQYVPGPGGGGCRARLAEGEEEGGAVAEAVGQPRRGAHQRDGRAALVEGEAEAEMAGRLARFCAQFRYGAQSLSYAQSG